VRATRRAFGVAVLVETGLARASLPRRFLVDNPVEDLWRRHIEA
jgi:hypothetical protein